MVEIEKSFVVVFGSRSIGELPTEAIKSLDKIMELELEVLVGDAAGIDSAVIRHLERNGYPNVNVFYSGRLRIATEYQTFGIPGGYVARDKFMCSRARWGLAVWDGISKGSKRNIDELGRRCKIILNDV